jgi:hypothetical protein
VSFLRRGRFDELVTRQLDLFAVDEHALLEEARAADEAWTRAGRDETEDLYGDYQLVVDAIADRLLEIRETYAATLDDDVRPSYREAFNREARRRFRRYATLLDDLDT